MKEFKQNKLPCHSHSTSPAELHGPARLVWHVEQHSEGRAEKAREKTAQTPTIDINSHDFDNKAFKTEKQGKFTNNLDSALQDALKKIPELKGQNDKIDQLHSEFSIGLSESIKSNKDNIAELINKTEFPALYAQKDVLTSEMALSWFQNILKTLKCDKIGLVYDQTDDQTKFRFYSGNKEIKFSQSDIKIQYIPKSPTTPLAPNTDFEIPNNELRTHLELNKQNYVVLTEIQTKSSYSDIAKAILEYETTKGAIIDGKKVLDDETCARIVRTNINIPEYAALLKSGHESIGKHNSLPILLPLTNLERANDLHSSKTKTEAEQHRDKVAAEGEKQLQDSKTAGLKVINLVRSPAEKKEIANYLAEYQAKIAAEKNPTKKGELLAKLLSNLDDYYKEEGITRSINKNTLAAMAGGKDNTAWRELWIKENPSVDNLMKLLGTVPDNPQLASLDKNTVRGIVYDLIEAGSTKTFTSGDIISHLKIKTPDGNAYDAILGLAAAPNASEPYMQRVQNKYRNFVASIEGLADAIEGLDPSKASELKLNKAGRLRVSESAEVSNEIPGTPAKDLLEIPKEKGEKLINNTLAKKVKEILNNLGVMETAKFVNTPENISKLKDNDQTWINIRYLNRDFTLHINNATVGWGVRVKPGFNQDAQNGETAYTTAGGMNIEEAVKGINRAISYQKFETADKGPESVNSKYDANLRKIFAFGLVDSNEKGRNLDMGDTNTNGGALSQYSKDEYFTKTSGTAAYNDFYDQVRTRDEKGKEIIDLKKANEKLENAYQKGKVKLQELARSGNEYYIDLQRQLKVVENNHKPIDLNFPVTSLEQKIIRLGYLAESEQKEKDQSKSLDKFKEQLVENILKLLPEKVTGPDGQVINKDQMRATLKEFPVGILLSHSYNADKSHSVGLHLPIILDVFNSNQAKMVIVPGVGNEGLRLAVGLSFTSKDPAKDQNVIFFGGVSIGASTNGSIGPAIGGGVNFRISKADEISNYNHYLGIQAGLGLDITKGQAGFNIGPTFNWEIDPQKKYENSLREAFEKDGTKNLLDELKIIYRNGSKPQAIEAFTNKLKTNPQLASKLGINANTKSDDVLIAFDQYIGGFVQNFNEKFNLPRITAGQIGISVVDGTIIGTGLATGQAPVVLGGVAKWGIQVLAGLKFNIGSKMVMERERKTTEREMDLFADKQKQNQFDEQFSHLPKSAQSSRLYLSGRNTLDAAGNKQTSLGEEVKVTTDSAEVQVENLSAQLDKFNKSLLEKGIDLKLQKNPDNSIEIVLLNTKVNANEKFLISPEVAIRTGDRLFLKNPNNLKYLYFDKQSRKYPLETSHGATIESITTISDNRFHSGKSFPTEISITRFADQKDQPYIEGKTGVAEKYTDNSTDYKAISESQKKMAKALDKSTGIEKENIRPDIKKIAKDIFKYKTSANETFINLTNIKAKGNETNPDNESPNLYAFYDKYTTDKKITPPFNAAEKDILTLELSTLRYTDLQAGAQSKAEKLSRFEKRLDWAKGTLQPYFENRLEELQKSGQIQLAQGESIKQRATLLVDKAVDDLKYSFYNEVTKLEKGTSVSVAIGVRADLPGGRVGPKISKGLHQMLDGSREGLQTNELDSYGYIFGKDYTDALQTGTPQEDHDIALILMGQLSHLPERNKVKEFMDSSLARKLASNGGLAFLLGKENYEKVIQHYEKGTGTPAELAPFMNVVEQIRKAEQNGEKLISVTGDKGVSFQIRINTKIQSGVFQKCANYSSTINEEIVILPPSEVEAMNLLVGAGEQRTTLNAKTYKQFTSLFGGVTSTVSLDTAPAEQPTPQKPEAGPEGEVKGSAAPAPEDRQASIPEAKQVTPGPTNDSP